MNRPVIIDAVRTPFGKRGGALSHWRPDSLLAHTVQGILKRSGLEGDHVDDLIAGCVTQAGEQGGNVARQAALLAGLPIHVPGVTLNRMCGSGQTAVHMAAQAVAAGDAGYAIGGGVESMSRVPMFVDVTLGPAFTDWQSLNPDLLARHELPHQGISAEYVAQHWGLTRAELDAYAMESHRRAHMAAQAQHHKEIVGIDITIEGAKQTLCRDEGIRTALSQEKMASLQPIFDPEHGIITAGNASQMTDGAAAVLVGNEERARADGLPVKARFLARVTLGSDPRMQLDGILPATRKALKTAGLDLTDIDWIEVNEAFACVPLAWSREFGVEHDRFNQWGGAIAHGHPLGATGAGLIAKTLSGLEATDGTLGLIVFCVGHGMATATIVERC
ncbi:MAG: acetyl-CoA C-acyltransferase [Burkholderiaceae bacterium]